MQKFMTGNQLMENLGVSRDTLALWAACGVLNPVQVGTALIYDPDEVVRLQKAQSRPVEEEAPPSWVVRLSAPGHEEEDGHPVGWQEGREGNVEAARGWWRIARPELAAGRALVAAVGPLVVGVWNIKTGEWDPNKQRSRFEVSEASQEQLDAYKDRWLHLRPGPIVMRWPKV